MRESEMWQAGAAVRDVGYAGMKDRRGVTTQWFSVGLQEAANDDWARWEIPGVTIQRAARHGRKLQRGALKGNRFRITLRDLRGEASAVEERLSMLADQGLPNYFGPQRFGRNGDNAERGARWLERGGRISRGQRGIYLSAVRSYLFNEVLAERLINQDKVQYMLGPYSSGLTKAIAPVTEEVVASTSMATAAIGAWARGSCCARCRCGSLGGSATPSTCGTGRLSFSHSTTRWSR